MSENTLSEVDVEMAGKVLRHVESTEALEAGILNPMAGTRAVRLFSLEESERFLVVHDGTVMAAGGAYASVNYVEPAHLATWIAEVLGDQELCDGIREVMASRRPYGFLVPEMKSLIVQRLEQCKRALEPVDAAAK